MVVGRSHKKPIGAFEILELLENMRNSTDAEDEKCRSSTNNEHKETYMVKHIERLNFLGVLHEFLGKAACSQR